MLHHCIKSARLTSCAIFVVNFSCFRLKKKHCPNREQIKLPPKRIWNLLSLKVSMAKIDLRARVCGYFVHHVFFLETVRATITLSRKNTWANRKPSLAIWKLKWYLGRYSKWIFLVHSGALQLSAIWCFISRWWHSFCTLLLLLSRVLGDFGSAYLLASEPLGNTE